MEKAVISAAQNAITKAITEELVGYNKPLSKLVNNSIDKHSVELSKIIDGEFSALLDSETFKASLKQALNEKLAKVLVGKMGAELEKQVTKLKQNPETRAKITLAISSVIAEL